MDKINTNLREDGTLEILLGNALFAEIANGSTQEDFVEEVLEKMGYVWNPDGTITKNN